MDLALIQKAAVELNNEIVGGIISKVFQPLPRELALKIFLPGKGERRLMLSADPKLGRIHLTRLRIPNPPRPPRFCAYLRAHLLNARIVKVSCAIDDRIVNMSCELRSLGSRMKRDLVLELLGRDSNIILVDADTKVIMDCLHHLPNKTSCNRAVLPGVQYVAPPKNPNQFKSPLEKNDLAEICVDSTGFSGDNLVCERVKAEPDSYNGCTGVNDHIDALYSNLLVGSLVDNFRREISRPIRSRIRALANRTSKIENDKQRLEK